MIKLSAAGLPDRGQEFQLAIATGASYLFFVEADTSLAIRNKPAAGARFQSMPILRRTDLLLRSSFISAFVIHGRG